MKLIPHAKIVDNDNEKIKKFGLYLTRLSATKLNNGIIEVFVGWSANPDFLKPLQVVDEGTTLKGWGSFEDAIERYRLEKEENTTLSVSASAVPTNVFSVQHLNFSEATYTSEGEEDEQQLSMLVALDQENNTMDYRPIFIHNKGWSCSVYFAPDNWQDSNEDTFFEVEYND